MPISPKEKTYYAQKISALRKGLQSLEEELGREIPVLPKKNTNSLMQQFEECYSIGTWKKPVALKKQNKKVIKLKASNNCLSEK